MEDNKRIVVVGILLAFIVFVLLISLTTGTNPIDSLFLLLGQTIMYVGMLFVFGAPLFLLFALISMTVSERMKSKDPNDPENLLRVGGKKIKPARSGKSKKQQRRMPPEES